MKNKILIVFIIFTMLVSILVCGCSYVEKQCEDKQVEVKIIDEYYKSAYTQMIHSGRTMIPIHHNAEYKIIVLYNNEEYAIDNKETYYKYKNKINEMVNATLKITTIKYTDKEIITYYDIISLE